MTLKERLRVTADGCIDERDMIRVRSIKKVLMQIATADGMIERKMIHVPLEIKKGFEPVMMYADAETGTVYDPATGRCNSTALRLMVS